MKSRDLIPRIYLDLKGVAESDERAEKGQVQWTRGMIKRGFQDMNFNFSVSLVL